MAAMINKRLELHQKLIDILGSGNVYYQPPDSLHMDYPAIRYSRDDIGNSFANDNVYKQTVKYEVIVIDEDPDSEIVERLSTMPQCQFNRHYTADGLNHDVFTLIY